MESDSNKLGLCHWQGNPNTVLFFSTESLVLEPGLQKLAILTYTLSGPCDEVVFLNGLVSDLSGLPISACGFDAIYCVIPSPPSPPPSPPPPSPPPPPPPPSPPPPSPPFMGPFVPSIGSGTLLHHCSRAFFSLSLLWARARLVFCRVVSLLLLTSGLRRRGGRYHNCWRWRSNSTSLLDHCVGHDILRFRYFNIAKSVGPLSSECGECVSVWVWVCMCVLGR